VSVVHRKGAAIVGTCFVIQPFDGGGAYDKRYSDVFEPAITAAGLDPYRVDRDPSAEVPIQSIEEGIRAADVCFAEISTDNPNVWYELGFAFAAGRPVVLVCATDRARFPFDIQHRNVIRYATDSTSDFDEAKDQITERIRAVVELRANVAHAAVPSVVAPQSGLSPQQLSALVVIGQRTGLGPTSMSAYELTNEMSSVGFTEIATTLAVRGLLHLGYVEDLDVREREDDEPDLAFRATEQGMDWLDENQDKLVLRRESAPPRTHSDLDNLPF
jgi:hypothetical protein